MSRIERCPFCDNVPGDNPGKSHHATWCPRYRSPKDGDQGIRQDANGTRSVAAMPGAAFDPTVPLVKRETATALEEAHEGFRAIRERVANGGPGWQRVADIAAIPDEKIDTSDIPEQGEEFFRQARLRNG